MVPKLQHRGAKYGSWKLVKSIGSGGAGAGLKGACSAGVGGRSSALLCFFLFFFPGAGNEISALVHGRQAPYHRALHPQLSLQVLTGRELTFRTVRSPS